MVCNQTILEYYSQYFINLESFLFIEKNKAAGARARKAALELMKDLKEFRKASVEASK